MRINHTSATTIDNIFIDISHLGDYLVIPFSNDLSDHDAQILTTIKISFQIQSDRLKICSKESRQIHNI
jgi:predicted rRNA methylase YqxC with S4 and FtsJ domains